MRQNPFGPLGHASALILGGGGIGMLWGPTDRDEARATLMAAIDGGIDVLDTAPIYAQCEAIVGETFGGRLPAHVRITTKCQLGSPEAAAIPGLLEASLAASLATMRLERADVFFLHSNLCADDYVYANRPDLQDRVATRWSLYLEQVVPTMRALQASGRIGAWGLSGIGVPDAIVRALRADAGPDTRPHYVQAITNLLDSAGAIRRYAEPAEPRRIISEANAAGVTVLGIRAVQAGALTDAIDRPLSGNHPETKDFERAAPFRAWCAARGESAAAMAHRYALSMPGVATVVLGVKNRVELAECLAAEAQGALDAATMAEIDALGLRV